jgi:hypothetical protein
MGVEKMNWLNIETKILHAKEYIGAKPKARATWINLMLWCAEQENGGTVADAKTWPDRRWQQTCGVTRKEANSAAPLVTFSGNDAVVLYYPVAQQATALAKRVVAKENGQLGGRPAVKKPNVEPISVPTSESVKEGKGREGKEKEKEGGEEKCPPASDSPSGLSELSNTNQHQRWEDFTEEQCASLVKAAGSDKCAKEGVEIWRARKIRYKDEPMPNSLAFGQLMGDLERRRRENAPKLILVLVAGNKIKIDPEEIVAGEKRYTSYGKDCRTNLEEYSDNKEWILSEAYAKEKKEKQAKAS